MNKLKHYDASVPELKILQKHLKNYVITPRRSIERSNVIDKAKEELNSAGFSRWTHKNISTYFNNNKRNIDTQQQLSQTDTTQSLEDTTIEKEFPHFTNSSSDENNILTVSQDADDENDNIEDKQKESLFLNEFPKKSDEDKKTNENKKEYENKKEEEDRKENEEIITITPIIKKVNIYRSESESGCSTQSSSLSSRTNSLNLESMILPYIQSNNNLEDLFDKLPKICSQIDSNIDQTQYDQQKFELNQALQHCYRIMHKMVSYFKDHPDEIQSKRLKYQIRFENKWIEILNALYELTKKDIYSYDPNIEVVKAPGMFKKFSGTTRRYNDEVIFSESSQTSSSIFTDAEIEAIEDIKDPKQEDIKNKYLKDFAVSTIKSQHSKIKLESTIEGNADLTNLNIQKFTDSNQMTTAVSYHLTKKNESNEDEDFLVFEIIHIYQTYESCFLCFNTKKIEIKSFSNVKAIYFYHNQSININQIYICGKECVKEFTIIGFDEYILSEQNDFNIEETNSYLFGKNKTLSDDVEKDGITIWNNQLVVGSNSTLLIWDIEQKNAKLIEIENIKNITSLAAIENAEDESYLAVASIQYPVIYIYDKNYKNISRLISHTMGISSLKVFNKMLFSSSSDSHIRIWNIDDCSPIMDFNTRHLNVKTIETGFYLGQFFLFAADDKFIQCFNITNKKFIFFIKYTTFVPKKMLLLGVENKNTENFAKLVILADYNHYSENTELVIQLKFLPGSKK